MLELKSVWGTCGAGAVKDVSFRLPNGKTYGVFSSRYADAVALCSLMSGARTPTGGVILAGGFDLHREARQARRGIGYLPPDLLPDGELTPIEYLMTVADVRELPYDKTLRRAHELLELADLADKKDCLIANLSHGEGRILCLLQTLLGNPEILILSSLLSGLTPKDAQKMRDLIRYFSDTYTIFLCTPSPQNLCELCGEIIILQDGALSAIAPATAEELLREYSTATAEASAPEASKPRKRTRWSMLTEKSDDYEVLENNEKEGKS